MPKTTKALAKLRTFKEDFLRAQEKAGVKPSAPAPVTTPNEPAADGAPVVVPQPAPVASRTPSHAAPSFDEIVSKEETARTAPKQAKVSIRPNEPSAEPVSVPEDLSEEVTTIGASEKDSFLGAAPTTADVFDDDGGDGTIITDQKNQRIKLLPALYDAMKDWGIEIKEKVQGPPEPVHTVASSQTREEVLKKAAERSSLAPQDDYHAVAKAREEAGPAPERVEQTMTIGAEAEIPTPTWSYVSDDTVMETPSEEMDEPELDPEPSALAAQYQTPEPTPAAPVTPATAVEAVPPPEPVVTEPDVTPEPVTPPAPAVAAAPLPAPQPTVPATPPPVPSIQQPAPTPVQPQTVSVPPPAQTIPPVQQYVRAAAGAYSRFTGQSALKFGAVIFAAIVLGVSVSVWLFAPKNSVVVQSTTVTSALVYAEEDISVSLTSSQSGLMQNLLAVTPQEGTSVAHIYPTVVTTGGVRPANAGEILNTLNPRIPGTFSRTIETINFGYYNGREPFMILQINSFDNALSGMLTWEANMSADLAPFFGPPVSGSFDQQSRTVTQVVPPFFVDTVVANLDARVLSNEIQEERMMYSFLDRGTILITTSREALEALSAVVK